jgi:molybdenum cofactor biosynthesis enzyme MoaA
VTRSRENLARGENLACLTAAEVVATLPAHPPIDRRSALLSARRRTLATGQWTACQFMGRRWPIGCVALEITQRCNLDCTACYLSENSESVKDLPLREVFRRIDMIFDHYGRDTDVQVTGGDPTLREKGELVEIVRRIRQKGMRPTLFTNGIRAKRPLLEELVGAGLVDVAFHVDLTQNRRGYETEIALNAVRREYVERARGLGLPVMFNTTVTNENFNQIPDVVRFFVRNSDAVRLASFQIHAETGRGKSRGSRLGVAALRRQIEAGVGVPLSFDTAQVGHSRCNRYAMAAVTNGKAYDILDDKRLFERVLEQTSGVQFDRQDRSAVVAAMLGSIVKSPPLTLAVSVWLLRKIWRAKRDLIRARGRVNKLSFFIHDFMDACGLEADRIDACVFMAATVRGPVSMCLHNAKRDAFILEGVPLSRNGGLGFWDPLTGKESNRPQAREDEIEPEAGGWQFGSKALPEPG